MCNGLVELAGNGRDSTGRKLRRRREGYRLHSGREERICYFSDQQSTSKVPALRTGNRVYQSTSLGNRRQGLSKHQPWEQETGFIKAPALGTGDRVYQSTSLGNRRQTGDRVYLFDRNFGFS